MSKPVRLRAAARQEMRDAVRWYERHDRKAADLLALELVRVFALIGELPEVFAERDHRGVRRAVLKRFPYLVFYIDLSHRVEVLTIVDGRRNPSTIARRVYKELNKPSDPA